VGNPGVTTGRVNGQLVAAIPVTVDKHLLQMGQKKYSIVCAQCHGVLGDGNSIVAENMALRLPPSLLELSSRPAGHFFNAITQGYGVMPSFSGELDTQERWAVVAYVRALQAARGTAAGQPPLPQENR
jgi:mono/diheme cytochrome c family protein